MNKETNSTEDLLTVSLVFSHLYGSHGSFSSRLYLFQLWDTLKHVILDETIAGSTL